MNLFSGLLVQPKNIPDYWIWMYYLSFFQYPYQIVVVNEFQNLTFQACNPLIGQYCPLGLCPNDPAHPLVPGNCSGEVLLNNLSYDPNDLPRNFGIMVGFFFVHLFFLVISLSDVLSE